jgi:hypothetical protein
MTPWIFTPTALTATVLIGTPLLLSQELSRSGAKRVLGGVAPAQLTSVAAPNRVPHGLALLR